MAAQAQPEVPPAPDASYAHAAFPEPFRILGRRLRPFSLGHYLLLQRFGVNTESPDRSDLIVGVLICSMRHEEFLAFLEQNDFLEELRKWGKKIGLFDLAEKSALFNRYLNNSLREPDYIPLQPGDDSGDWAQNLKMTLTTRLGYSEAEALDLPLSKALADYYKLAEGEGLIRLITPEERAAGAANAEALRRFSEDRGSRIEDGKDPVAATPSSILHPPSSTGKGEKPCPA